MGTYIESLRTWLLERGYTPGSIKHVLTLAGQLGRGMESSDVKFSQLDSVAVESLLDALRARGVRRVPGPRGLRPLLDYLDSEGALAFKPVPDSPIERLVVEYRTWLVVDRGLAAPTVLRYENLARRFLDQQPATDDSMLAANLTAADVVGFLLRLAGDIDDMARTLTRLPSRQLVVIGAPGAGKSTLAVLLTLGLHAQRQPGDPVPVPVTLTFWDPDHGHLDTWLARRLAEAYPGLHSRGRYGADAAARPVAAGLVLPVLDGLDEMPEPLHARAVAALTAAVGRDRPLVLTSRAEEYQSAVRQVGGPLARAAVVEVEPVTAADAADYLPAGQVDGQARWRPVLTQPLRRPGAAHAADGLPGPRRLPGTRHRSTCDAAGAVCKLRASSGGAHCAYVGAEHPERTDEKWFMSRTGPVGGVSGCSGRKDFHRDSSPMLRASKIS